MANFALTNWYPHLLLDNAKHTKLKSIYKGISDDEAILGDSRRWRDLRLSILDVNRNTESNAIFINLPMTSNNQSCSDSSDNVFDNFVRQNGDAELNNLIAKTLNIKNANGTLDQVATRTWVLSQIGVINTTYNPSVDDAITTNKDVGNLDKGTTAGNLDGLTINQLLDRILFKELQPTVLNAPDLTARLETSLVKPNTTTTVELVLRLNRGEYTYDGVTNSGKLIGTGESIFFNNTLVRNYSTPDESETTVTVNVNITVEDRLYRTSESARVTYLVGTIINTSYGNPAPNISGNTNPYPAGNITKTLSLETSIPFYIINDSDVFVEQPLSNLVTSTFKELILPALSNNKLQKFRMPLGTLHNLDGTTTDIVGATRIDQYNNISREWHTVDLTQYTSVDLVDPYGDGYNYREYTYSIERGEVQLRIYFK